MPFYQEIWLWIFQENGGSYVIFSGTHNQIVLASIFFVFWFSTGLQGKRGVQINLGASNFKNMFQKLENLGFQKSRQIQVQQKDPQEWQRHFNVKFCIKINHLVDLVVERIDLFCWFLLLKKSFPQDLSYYLMFTKTFHIFQYIWPRMTFLYCLTYKMDIIIVIWNDQHVIFNDFSPKWSVITIYHNNPSKYQ